MSHPFWRAFSANQQGTLVAGHFFAAPQVSDTSASWPDVRCFSSPDKACILLGERQSEAHLLLLQLNIVPIHQEASALHTCQGIRAGMQKEQDTATLLSWEVGRRAGGGGITPRKKIRQKPPSTHRGWGGEREGGGGGAEITPQPPDLRNAQHRSWFGSEDALYITSQAQSEKMQVNSAFVVAQEDCLMVRALLLESILPPK